MSLSRHPRTGLRATARRALVAIACLPALAIAQEPVSPHDAMLRKADRIDLPGTLVIKDGAAPKDDALSRAIADVGESPLAAILEAAGPDVRRYTEHSMTLANPFFEGRAPGTMGNRFAADYIEFWFRQSGLRPAFPSEEKAADGTIVRSMHASFRQPFEHGSRTKVERQSVSMDLGGDGQLELRPGRDFTVLGMSGSGVVKGPIALVGYSIPDGEGKDGYASYPERTSLKGKIAVVFRYEPMDGAGKSRWGQRGWSPAASLEDKLRAAAERGAAGIILVTPPGAADPRAKQLSETAETRPQGQSLKIPVVMVQTEIVDRLVQAADPTDGPRRTLMDFRNMADEAGGVIDLPNAPVSIAAGISVEPIMTDNVGAVLPGRGKLADQYIIIGAHYDHVGYGNIGADPRNRGKLHPGADDNASGTSGLLLISEKLAKAYGDLPEDAEARSVLFLAFSAEESGLIGSKYYVDHPSLATSQMYLMLNMDMIGRLRGGKLEVQGTQSAEGFYDWLKPRLDESGLEIEHGPQVAGNSDHASFYGKKVPVLFFFSGYHDDYHKPTDFGYRLNQVGGVQVVNLVYSIALAAAQRTEPLEFAGRRRGAAEPAGLPAVGSAPARTGTRVRFGIAPGSYSDATPGVPVGDVYEGTPAFEAGIKPGDRMIMWNGRPTPTVEDWMPLFTAQKPGDVVQVTVLREGKEMTFKVTLTARDESAR